jgi:hypothetical protein
MTGLDSDEVSRVVTHRSAARAELHGIVIAEETLTADAWVRTSPGGI